MSINLRKGPEDPDGKPVVVQSPATEGLYTLFTCRSDDVGAGTRGTGNMWLVSYTDAEGGVKTAEMQFIEPVEIHDAHASWDPPSALSFEDEWKISIELPATTVYNDGTFNCIKYEVVPSSGLHILLPSATPTHRINLDPASVPEGESLAVVSPAGKDELGYWLVHRWTEKIEMLPAPQLGSVKHPEKMVCNLYDFANTMYFVNPLNCGDPRGIWDMDAYKAEWISTQWKLKFSIDRTNTSGAVKVGGWIMIFRPGAT